METLRKFWVLGGIEMPPLAPQAALRSHKDVIWLVLANEPPQFLLTLEGRKVSIFFRKAHGGFMRPSMFLDLTGQLTTWVCKDLEAQQLLSGMQCHQRTGGSF